MLEKTRTIVLGGAGVAYFEHPGIFESYSVTELSDRGLQQLVAAVIRQAVFDAAAGDKAARRWLRTVGADWAEIAGIPIATTVAGIERAIQRKQADGRGRHRPGRAARGVDNAPAA